MNDLQRLSLNGLFLGCLGLPLALLSLLGLIILIGWAWPLLIPLGIVGLIYWSSRK